MLMERWLQLKMGLFHAHRNHERNKNKKKERKGINFLMVSTHLEDFRGILVGNCGSYACKVYHCIMPKNSEYDHIGMERRVFFFFFVKLI